MPKNFKLLHNCTHVNTSKVMLKILQSRLQQYVNCNPMDYIAHQALLSMGFFRPEYWSGLPFPSAGDLPNPGIEPGSLALQADSLQAEPPGKPSSDNLFNHHKIPMT